MCVGCLDVYVVWCVWCVVWWVCGGVWGVWCVWCGEWGVGCADAGRRGPGGPAPLFPEMWCGAEPRGADKSLLPRKMMVDVRSAAVVSPRAPDEMKLCWLPTKGQGLFLKAVQTRY